MTNLICHDLNIVKHLLIVVWDSCKLLNYKTLKLYKMFEIPTMVVHCIRANPHIIQSLHFIDILVHVVQSKWKTFCMDQQLQVSLRLMFFKNVLSTIQIFSVMVVVVKTSDGKTISEVYYPIAVQLGYT